MLNHNTYGLNGDVGAARFGSYGIQFHGTKGTLFIDRSGFRITPQVMRQEEPNQPPPTPDHRQPPAGLLLHDGDHARAVGHAPSSTGRTCATSWTA